MPIWKGLINIEVHILKGSQSGWVPSPVGIPLLILIYYRVYSFDVYLIRKILWVYINRT